MVWGTAQINGKTKYALLLIPVLFSIHPMWALFEIEAYGSGEWCRPHEHVCLEISSKSDPVLIHATLVGNLINIFIQIALIGVMLFAIRRADKFKSNGSLFSSRYRLVALIVSIVAFAYLAFRH